MSKKCTTLWREARLEIKPREAPQLRSTFASWAVRKVHAVVARSTCRSQNVKSTPCSEHFGKLRCSKSARQCGEAHFKVQSVKNWGFRKHFEVRMWFCVAGARDSAPSQKWAKQEGFVVFCSSSKSVGRRGPLEEDLQRCMSCDKRNTRDMFIRDVRKSGRWFPEKGCVLEHQIFRFAKVILRDRCSTSDDLAPLFRGSGSTLDRWSGNIAKRIGTRPSALHSTVHFLYRFWCSQLWNWRRLADLPFF